MIRLEKLLVEDETDIRDILQDCLTHLDFSLHFAEDGRRAKAILEAGLLPNVIVVDQIMPGLNGLGLLSWLRGHPPTRHIPVIAVSGNLWLEDAQQYQVFFLKPYSLEKLEEAIRKWGSQSLFPR